MPKTNTFQLKTVFEDIVHRRKFENQGVELFLKCGLLNRMIQGGKPDS